jgi:hypothetical protein
MVLLLHFTSLMQNDCKEITLLRKDITRCLHHYRNEYKTFPTEMINYGVLISLTDVFGYFLDCTCLNYFLIIDRKPYVKIATRKRRNSRYRIILSRLYRTFIRSLWTSNEWQRCGQLYISFVHYQHQLRILQ